MISIKSQTELELMGQAGKIVSLIIEELSRIAGAGISTYALDKKAAELFEKYGAKSAFKNYRGFPGNICTSINEELIHGIPSKKRILKEGDILSVDIGANFKGFFADAAVTVPIGRISDEAKRLIETTKESLFVGIVAAGCNTHLSDVSCAIQSHVEAKGFSVVKEFVGHGIGALMHEEPEIPNYGRPGHGPVLKNGMTLAIEPMVNAGTSEVAILSDGWTVVTRDEKLCAHFEHTICIANDHPRILTDFNLSEDIPIMSG